MGRMSRQKGKVGEREAVNVVCIGMWGCKDAARTSQRRGDKTPDIDLGLPMHCEVKRHARIAAIRFLEQAERDSHGEQPEFVLMREDGDTEWVFMCRASRDCSRNAESAVRQRGNRQSADPATRRPPTSTRPLGQLAFAYVENCDHRLRTFVPLRCSSLLRHRYVPQNSYRFV